MKDKTRRFLMMNSMIEINRESNECFLSIINNDSAPLELSWCQHDGQIKYRIVNGLACAYAINPSYDEVCGNCPLVWEMCWFVAEQCIRVNCWC